MRKLYVIILFCFTTSLTYGQITISTTRTEDTDLNGHIDRIVLVLTGGDMVDVSTLDANGVGILVTGYTISTGGVTTPGGVDSQFILVDLEELTTFDTDATPNITVANDAFFGPGAQSVATYDAPAFDAAPPSIAEIIYRDLDEDGYIDHFEFIFSEQVGPLSILRANDLSLFFNGGFNGADFGNNTDNVISVAASSAIVALGSASTIQVTAALEGLLINTQNAFSLQDQASPPNINTATGPGSLDHAVVRDGAAPVIVSAETDDTNGDGSIDLITVEFSENIEGAGGGDITTLTGPTSNEVAFQGNDVVEISLFESNNPDTDEVPDLQLMAGAIQDLATPPNAVTSNQDFTSTTDGAAPAIISFRYLDNSLDGFVDHVEVAFSETVTAASILRQGDLFFLDNGDFTGAAFGSGDNIITGLTENASIPIGIPPTNRVTFSSAPIVIITQDLFSLTDGVNENDRLGVHSSAEILDGAAPVIVDIEYRETGADDGIIDVFAFTFSEVLDESSSVLAKSNIHLNNDGDFDGMTFGASNEDRITGSDGDEFFFNLSGGTPPTDIDTHSDISLQFSLVEPVGAPAIFLMDLSNNVNTITEVGGLQNQSSFSDGANPVVENVETRDLDGNGELDQILVTFSEALDPTSIDYTASGGITDDFSMSDSYLISSVSINELNDEIIEINLHEKGEPDTDAIPTVTFTANEFLDLDGNIMDGAPIIQAVDGAPPVIYSASVHESNTFAEVVISENIERIGGGNIIFEDFNDIFINSGGGDVTIQVLDVVSSNGSPLSASGNTFLFTLEIDPNSGTYDPSDHFGIGSDGGTLREFGGNLTFSDQTSPSPQGSDFLTPNNLSSNEFPHISNATWVRTNSIPPQGYIEITFSQELFRNFTFNRSPRLGNFESDNTIDQTMYSNGTADTDPGSYGELFIEYSTGSGTATINTNDNGDIQLLDADGNIIEETNGNYDGTVYRLQLNDISNSFTGGETYTFRPFDGISIKGRSSGKYMPRNYSFEFALPDITPGVLDEAVFQDMDNNGIADQVSVSLVSENFDDQTVEPSDFSFNGNDLNAVLDDPGFDNNLIILDLANLQLDGDEPFQLTYTDYNDGIDLSDTDGNNIVGGELVVIDEVPPVILSATTRDTNLNGYLDAIDLVFTETIDDSSLSGFFDDFSIENGAYTISGYDNSVGPANNNLLTLILDEGTVPDAGTIPSIQLLSDRLYDASGENTLPANNDQNFTGTIDGAAPAIIAVETGDVDGNGFLDQLTITFSEDIDGSTIDGTSDFVISNPAYTYSNAVHNGTNGVTLTLTEEGQNYDTGETPEVQLVALQVADESNNTNTVQTAQDFDETTDGAAPAIVELEYRDEQFGIPDGFIDRFIIRFSEPLSSSSDLSRNNLSVSNASDFGMRNYFGTSGTDMIGGGETEILVTFSQLPTVQVTGEIDDGTLEIQTQNGFNLDDESGNSYTTEEPQSHVQIVDGSGPVIVDFRYNDGVTSGIINRFFVQFSERIDGSNSFLSSNNLSLIEAGNLSNADFGASNIDRLPNGSYYESPNPLGLGDQPDNSFTGPTGLQITLQNNANGPPFIFTDLSGNETNEAYLTPPGLEQDQATFTDDADPIVLTSVTVDSDNDGKIDRIEVTLSETIDINDLDSSPNGVSGDTDQFDVDGYNILLVTTGTGVDDEVIYINLDEMENPDTDAIPDFTILTSTISDLSDNNFLAAVGPLSTTDGAGPIIIDAITVDDGDGHIDAIDIEFDGPIHDASLNIGLDDFLVDGYTIAGYNTDPAAIGAAAEDDAILRIVLTPLTIYDTDVTPYITLIAGEVEDNNMNALLVSGLDQEFTETVDGADPVYVTVPDDDGGDKTYNASETITFTLTTSEHVDAVADLSDIGQTANQPMSLASENATTGYTYSYTTAPASVLNDGLHTVDFTITDYVGNPGPTPASSINVEIDNIIPTITITTLETIDNGDEIITGTIDANGDGDLDDLGVEVSIDGGGFSAASNNGLGSGTWQFTTNQGNGIHNIEARVRDPFGNETYNINDTDEELQIGGVSVTAPTLDNICIDGDFLALGSIVIQEIKSNDFKSGQNRTFFINLPNTDFAFDTSVTPGETGAHDDISNVNFSYFGPQSLRIEVDINHTDALDVISIQGLQVHAIGGSSGNFSAMFSNGTASIFGIAEEDQMASLTTVNAPAVPDIHIESAAGQVVTEVEVEVGDGAFTLYTDEVVNSYYNWYDYDGGPTLHTGSSAMMSNLDNDGGPAGFEIDVPGLYSIYVGETNEDGCESVLRKINIYVYDRQLNPDVFSFVNSNEEGTLITIENDPANFEGVFLGPGLSEINLSGDAMARFVPADVPEGSYEIIFRVTNDVTSENYDFITPLAVNPDVSIFSIVPEIPDVASSYCNDEPEFVMNASVGDLPKVSDGDPSNYYFYGFQIREKGTANIVSDVLQSPEDTWNDILPIDTDKPTNNWRIDPSHFVFEGTENEYTIDLLMVEEGQTNADHIEIFNSFDLDIYKTPEAAIDSPGGFVCEDEAPFTFSASLTLDGVESVVSVDEYLVNGPGTPPEGVLISNNQFNPSNPMGLDPVNFPQGYPAGDYTITYTSDPDDNPNGCIDDADEITITVLAKPNPILPEQGIVIMGHGELVSGTYLLEYCEGDIIDDLVFALGNYENALVFIDASLTSVLEIADNDDTDGQLIVTGDDLIGSVANKGIDEDFYIVFENNTDQEGGCSSDPIEFRYIVREIPNSPAIPDIDLSEAGGLISEGIYEYNYCTDVEELGFNQLEMITLNDLPSDGESYFNIYDNNDVLLLGKVTSNDIDLSDPVFSGLSLTVGSSNLIQIEEVNNDNSALSPSPVERTEFTGCTSSRTQVFINIFPNPNAPIQAEFSDNPNLVGDVITYYLCQGDEFDITINAPEGINDYLYEWFEGSGVNDPITVTDNQGDRITSSDLSDETFAFNTDGEGIYSMSVRLNSNVRENASFSGCASELTRVDIVVFPTPETLTISSDGQEGEAIGGFEHVYEFCVESGVGLPSATIFETNAIDGPDNLNQVEWYEANEAGTEISGLNPVAVGNSVTATDLGIVGEENNLFRFAAAQRTNIIDGYEEFSGCTGNIVFFQVSVNLLPDPNFTFQGITEGRSTTFNFIDNNLSEINEITFEVTSLSNGNVVSFEGSLAANVSDEDFSHAFTEPGIYEGVLKIRSQAGCERSIARQFRILDQIDVDGIRVEDFDDPDVSLWFEEFQSDDGLHGSFDTPVRVSSWHKGTPVGTTINETWNGSGGAWTTIGYTGSERSFIYSPSYNVKLENPAIRVQTYRDFDAKDGVVLQYSLDDGLSWIPLGDYVPGETPPSTGQNWFTENGISSTPGNVSVGNGSGFNVGRVGWANKNTPNEFLELEETNGWATSIHSLATIPDLENIRFRFALSSSGAPADEKDGDGFGFDNFELFSQSKTLLIEHFTTTLSENNYNVDHSIENVINMDEVMLISYFTDLGNGNQSDQLNQRNIIDPGARAAYYGADAIPFSVLNGETYEQSVDPITNEVISDQLSWNQNDVNIKGLETPFFRIDNIQTSLSQDGGIVSVSADFNPLYTEERSNLSFYFAIVEKEIHPEEAIGVYDGTRVIRNALRILLPGPSGFNYFEAVSTGQAALNYSADWAVNHVYDPSQLRVIIFVQDNETQKVLQSAYADFENAAETVTGLDEVKGFFLHPNPADEEFSIEFEEALKEVSIWVLYDQSGREVIKGMTDKGTTILNIGTSDIASGVYLLNVFDTETSSKVARVIVTH